MKKHYFCTLLFALFCFPIIYANMVVDGPKNTAKHLLTTASGKTATAVVVWDEVNYASKKGIATFNTTDLSAVEIKYAQSEQATGGAVVDGSLYYFTSRSKNLVFLKVDLSTGKEIVLKEIPSSATTPIYTDLTYDYKLKTMYYIAKSAFGTDMPTTTLGTVNLTNGEIAVIGETPFILTLACNSNGQLYGIGKNKLYKIDKTNAKTEFIGNVNEEMSDYTQSMDFDRDSDELYWTGNRKGPDGFFAKVDVYTGASTRVGNFYNNSKFTCLSIPFTQIQSGAPAAVSNFEIQATKSGDLTSTISFNTPSLTSAGGSLTSINKIEIFCDETLIKTYPSPEKGVKLSFTETVSTTGRYRYKVVATNATGNGDATFKSIFMGEDLPRAPQNIVLTKSGSNAILNWTAPTVGIQTGWFNASQLRYKIVRSPDNAVVASAAKGTTFTDPTSQLGNYSYSIQSITDLGSGAMNMSNSLIIGTAFQTPYLCHFLTADEFALWTVLNVPEDEKKWEYMPSDRAVTCGSFTTKEQELSDWLISSPIAMQTGKTYKLKFDFKTKSGDLEENLKVFYGKGATADDLSTEILSIQNYKNTEYITHEAKIKPSESVAYNIGFGISSGPTQAGMSLTNVVVEKMVDNDLAAVSIRGNYLPTVGKTYNYTVSVKNEGLVAQQSYRVDLVSGGLVLASMEVKEAIAPDEIKNINIIWSPTLVGDMEIKGSVFLNDQLKTNNDTTPSFKIKVQAAGDNDWGVVGYDSILDPSMPIDYYVSYSTTQSIYLAEEIGLIGTIEKIVYKYNNKSGKTFTDKVAIHMSRTDSTNLSSKWISKEQMTSVFNDSLTIEKGEGEIEIKLSSPFVFAGIGNLCIMVSRENEDLFSSSISFLSTLTESPRTRTYSDDYAPFEEGPGMVKSAIPNILIYANTSGGKIEGVVKSVGEKVEGALITLSPHNISTITDVNGMYALPYAPVGTYTLTVSKQGYENKVIENIILSKTQTTTLDIEFSTLPKFTVTGTVKDAETNTNINAASIEITGYESFNLTTNENGEFSIPNVYTAHYSIKVRKSGLATYSGSFDVVDGNLDLPILLTEYPYAPSNLVATASESQSDLSWEAPANKVFRYDDGVITGQLGIGGGNNVVLSNYIFGSVHKIASALNSMSWITTDQGGAHDFVNVFVIEIDKNGKPTKNVLFSQKDVPNVNNKWSSFKFPNLIECPNGFMVAISYEGFLGIAHDAGESNDYPFIPKGNWYGDYTKEEYTVLDGRDAYNFMIRAEGYEIPKSSSSTPDRVVANTTEINSNPNGIRFLEIPCKPYQIENSNDQKSVQGYKVWRLLEGKENDEASWTLLTSTSILEKKYADQDWASLTDGAYKYAVKAVYKGTVSTSTFSNMLPTKGMLSNVTINVTTNTSPSMDGASVKLINKDNNPKHVYTATVNNGKVLFADVWKGIYKLSITLTNFTSIDDTNVNLAKAIESLNYELKEVIVKPYGLEIAETTNDYERIFKWNVNKGIEEGFEDHSDFAINSAGPIGWSYIDGDGGGTYGIAGFEDIIPHSGDPMAYQILNPSATTPPMLQHIPNLAPHSGKKLLAFITSTDLKNEDFLISPELVFANDFTFSFWARGYDRVESMKVGYSLTGKAQTDFTNWFSKGSSIEVGFDKWQKYTYTIPYAAKYVTVEYVSNDKFILMLDDIFIGNKEESSASSKAATKYEVYLDGVKVGDASANNYTFSDLKEGTYTAGVKSIYKSGVTDMSSLEFKVGKVGIENTNSTLLRMYPNPVQDILHIEGEYTSLGIYDIGGKLIMTANGASQIDLSKLVKGVYAVKVYHHNKFNTYKIVK